MTEEFAGIAPILPLPLIQSEIPKISSWVDLLEAPYQTGIFSNSGTLAKRAETLLASHIHPSLSGYLCSNATLGLQASLVALDLQGKSVAVSNFTFAATLQAVFSAGANPILCDVNLETLEIDLVQLKILIKSMSYKLDALLITRPFGTYRDYKEIIDYCEQNSIKVVIDAAASFPSKSNYYDAGNYLEVYSFHPTKPFSIGEAGLVVGRDESISAVKRTSNFGISPEGHFGDGTNAKADEFVAARAIAKFASYAESQDKRLNFVKAMYSVFEESKLIRLLPIDTPCTWGLLPLRFTSESKLLKFKEAISSKIMTKRYYFPSLINGYTGRGKVFAPASLENSQLVSSTTLCLPVYHEYSDDLIKWMSGVYSGTLSQL
jgi:dTDP-4-amino-4,6-dideoxygalactose transaminase